jgi:hypothetical protein
VSSDGINYYRFPSTSLTDTSGIGPFAYLDPTKLNNLAGKYKANFGTPFDLQELSSNIDLDLNNISHVRIIDVVGSVLPDYCSRDDAGRIIADPWPTPFPSSGFDLDAVGVIHDNNPAGFAARDATLENSLYPQPASESITITFKKPLEQPVKLHLYSISGVLVEAAELYAGNSEYTTPFQHSLSPGIYRLELESDGMKSNQLCIIN